MGYSSYPPTMPGESASTRGMPEPKKAETMSSVSASIGFRGWIFRSIARLRLLEYLALRLWRFQHSRFWLAVPQLLGIVD